MCLNSYGTFLADFSKLLAALAAFTLSYTVVKAEAANQGADLPLRRDELLSYTTVSLCEAIHPV